MTTDGEHRLHRIEHAALLYALGREPTRVEWEGPRLIFVFNADAGTREALAGYETGNGMMVLRADVAFQSIAAARRRLAAEKRAAGSYVDHG